MHQWSTIDMYSQFHPRWFESADHYAPSDLHLAAYRETIPVAWKLRRAGLWFFASPPGDVRLPDQGWKLHISVATKDSVAALQRALPVLRDTAVCFKFLVDPRVTGLVNGKLWPRGSGGKFITVYPTSPEQFHELGQHLAEEMNGFLGPYILSDRRWPDSKCVYYRYGGFSARSILQIDGRRRPVIVGANGGLVPDPRNAHWSLPGWVADPFPVASPPERSGAIVVGDGRFSVVDALSFTNRGGVYEATDNRTGRTVILKEARPYVEVGRNRLDAVAVLEKEFRLLQQLAVTGYYVRPVAYFREWEHAFLAEEHVTGDHIGRFTILNNPIYRGDFTAAALGTYLARMRELWLQIARAVAAAHARGIVLGDLSFTNIIVTDESQICIIDLEAAIEDGVDSQVGLYTPGLASASAMETATSDRANDYHALGAIIFGSIMLATGISGFYRPARRRFLRELTDDLALPGPLVALIDDLMEPSTPRGIDPDLIITRIAQLPTIDEPNSSGNVCRLGLPTSERLTRDRRVELRKRVAHTVDGIVEYLHGTADPSRDDRLWPADLMVFETNPLSVAYGAAGILHALHHISGVVPKHLLAWFLRHSVENEQYPPGLYVGQAGIAWVLAELECMEVAIKIMRAARRHDLLLESPDILHGAAGYGLACLKLWTAGAGQEFLDEAERIKEHLLESCVRDDRGVRWPRSSGMVPLGYAYGGSGIALFLLYLDLATGEKDQRCHGRSALEFELGQAGWHQGRFAGFPAIAMDKPEMAPVLKCYWDAGSAGVGTTLIRYLAVAPDNGLESWLPALVSDSNRKYTVFPQLFHGLAGLGNFLLDVWEQTSDDTYLSQAWQVAEGVLLFSIERPEGIAFPGEQAARESADLATGAAGIGLFLYRLLRAEEGVRGNLNFVLDELFEPMTTISATSASITPISTTSRGSTSPRARVGWLAG